MCGLVGAISTWLSSGEVEIFQHLSLVTTFRGKIGAGVAIVPIKEKKDIEILRDEETLAHIVLGPDFSRKTMNKDHKISVLMGHARAPTSGNWEIQHTHPHISGHIIGMHNGTFKKVRGIEIGKKDNDSQLLFEHIAQVGIEEAISQVEGPYALSWIDTRANTINFLRNDGRPLYFGHYKTDPNTLYWASEAYALQFVLRRENLDPKDDCIIKHLPVGQILSMRLRNSGEIKPIILKPLKASVPSVTTAPNHGNSNLPAVIPFPNKHRPVREAPAFMVEENEGKPVWETKENCWFPMRRVEDFLKKGCQACNRAASLHDFWTMDKLVWYKPEEYVCDECYAKDDDVRDYVNRELGVKN